MRNSQARLSMYGSRGRTDSACMARRSCQLHARPVTIAHDLPSSPANRGNPRGSIPDFDQFARSIQTGPRQRRATLSALSNCGSCFVDHLACLELLARCDDRDGRISSFPTTAPHRLADRLRACPAFRRRISRGTGAWNSLFACRRAAARCGVFALRKEPFARNLVRLLACRPLPLLGHDAIFAPRSNQLARAQRFPLALAARDRVLLWFAHSWFRFYSILKFIFFIVPHL